MAKAKVALWGLGLLSGTTIPKTDSSLDETCGNLVVRRGTNARQQNARLSAIKCEAGRDERGSRASPPAPPQA